MALKSGISEVIGLGNLDLTAQIAYRINETSEKDGYTQQLIEYDSLEDGKTIPAYLLVPKVLNHNPAVIIHHQHHSERHLGKSEVCGLAGDPLQAFGPALVRKGFVVLAPDSICFEQRRKHARGTEPLPGDGDFLQHYNELCYRILNGGNLMKKVLGDAMTGISLLAGLPYVDKAKIGTLGHSYGGNTVLFLAAMDERIAFGCASGSTCTYKNRIKNNVGIEMASVIPGFLRKYDIDDLVRCIAPRSLLIVSAEEDKYSMDADHVTEHARPAYIKLGAGDNLYHKRYPGGHALTQERFDLIINWLCAQ